MIEIVYYSFLYPLFKTWKKIQLLINDYCEQNVQMENEVNNLRMIMVTSYGLFPYLYEVSRTLGECTSIAGKIRIYQNNKNNFNGAMSRLAHVQDFLVNFLNCPPYRI